MTASRSDALVFFGATGDLAYKKIFPALQALIRRGHLDMPVIGVARSEMEPRSVQERGPRTAWKSTATWTRRRTRSSAPCWVTSTGITATRQLLRSCARLWRPPSGRCTTWPSRPACSPPSPKGWRRRAAPRTPAWSWRSPSAATSPRPRS